jgi:hypothetical protein
MKRLAFSGCVAVAVAFLLMFLPSPARAQTTLAESLPPSARAAYDSAKILLADGDYAGALLKFDQAYGEAKDARLLWNMASCEEKLRHYTKATKLLQRYLVEAGTNATADDRREAEEIIKTLDPFISKVVVTSDQPGVEIAVDDAVVGTTPLAEPIPIDQGARRIVGRKVGFVDAVKEATFTGGVVSTVILTMKKVVHEAQVTITAGANDTIAIDGKVVGVSRFEGPVASGGHELQVTAPGMRPYRSELVVADGEPRTLNVTLQAEAKSGGLPLWLWIAGGAVVVTGASIGAYFLFRPEDGQAPIGTMQPGTVQLSMFRLR